jgi:hypothetical protein
VKLELIYNYIVHYLIGHVSPHQINVFLVSSTDTPVGADTPYCKIIKATMTKQDDPSLTIGSAIAYLVNDWAKMSEAEIPDRLEDPH